MLIVHAKLYDEKECHIVGLYLLKIMAFYEKSQRLLGGVWKLLNVSKWLQIKYDKSLGLRQLRSCSLFTITIECLLLQQSLDNM